MKLQIESDLKFLLSRLCSRTSASQRMSGARARTLGSEQSMQKYIQTKPSCVGAATLLRSCAKMLNSPLSTVSLHIRACILRSTTCQDLHPASLLRAHYARPFLSQVWAYHCLIPYVIIQQSVPCGKEKLLLSYLVVA